MTLSLLADIAFYGAMVVTSGIPLVLLTVAVLFAFLQEGNRR